MDLIAKKTKGEVKVKKENPCAIKKQAGSLGETHEEKTIFKNLTGIVNKFYSPYQATNDNKNIDTACVAGVLTAIHEARVRNAIMCHAIRGTEHPLKSASKWISDYEKNLKSFEEGATKLKKSLEDAITEYKAGLTGKETASKMSTGDAKASKAKAKAEKKAAGHEKKGQQKIVKAYNKLTELAGHCITMNEQLLHHLDLNNLDSLVNMVNASFIVLQEACHEIVSTKIYGEEITSQYSKTLEMAKLMPQSFKEVFKINVEKLIKQNNDNYNKLIEYINKQIEKQGLTMIKAVDNAFETNQIEQHQQETINNYDKSVLEVGNLETDKDKMPNKAKTPNNSTLNDDDEDSEDEF